MYAAARCQIIREEDWWGGQYIHVTTREEFRKEQGFLSLEQPGRNWPHRVYLFLCPLLVLFHLQLVFLEANCCLDLNCFVHQPAQFLDDEGHTTQWLWAYFLHLGLILIAYFYHLGILCHKNLLFRASIFLFIIWGKLLHLLHKFMRQRMQGLLQVPDMQ